MKDLVILLHGFNVFDGGKKTVAKLKPFYDPAKYDVEVMDYGYFGFLSTRFFNDDVSRKLASRIVKANLEGRKVHLVGHSNGCTIIWLMHRLKWDKMPSVHTTCFINPALRQDVDIPYHLGWVTVFHAPSDLPVRLSKLLLVPAKFRPWGEMGAYGAVPAPKVWNVNLDRLLAAYGWVEEAGHSGAFDEPLLNVVGPEVAIRAAWRKY